MNAWGNSFGSSWGKSFGSNPVVVVKDTHDGFDIHKKQRERLREQIRYAIEGPPIFDPVVQEIVAPAIAQRQQLSVSDYETIHQKLAVYLEQRAFEDDDEESLLFLS